MSQRSNYYVSREEAGEETRIDDEAELELVGLIDGISTTHLVFYVTVIGGMAVWEGARFLLLQLTKSG